jgi:hypothetical protein
MEYFLHCNVPGSTAHSEVESAPSLEKAPLQPPIVLSQLKYPIKRINSKATNSHSRLFDPARLEFAAERSNSTCFDALKA